MSQKIIAFFNGQTMPLDELKVSVNDRAYVFGDAVYEVLRVYNGQPMIIDAHLKRLKNSLLAIGIKKEVELREQILSNIALNKVIEGMVYLQVSRGTAPRVHSFYHLDLSPNVLLYSKSFAEHPCEKDAENGITAIVHEDLRSSHCNIKSINLLANCLIQTRANEQGANEAILVRGDIVTEGTSCNIFMVKDGLISTPPLSGWVLPGTRRGFLIDRLKMLKPVEERPIKMAELFSADELFISSTIKEAIAIIRLDQKNVGLGQVGPIAKLARNLILKEAESTSQF